MRHRQASWERRYGMEPIGAVFLPTSLSRLENRENKRPETDGKNERRGCWKIEVGEIIWDELYCAFAWNSNYVDVCAYFSPHSVNGLLGALLLAEVIAKNKGQIAKYCNFNWIVKQYFFSLF